MTLEQLRVFVAVAERQHMTRAADALNMAQSAVSAAIAALEGRHGAKLFHRVGRGIELTEAGKMFLIEANGVLAKADKAELMLAQVAGLKRGRLIIQASETIASYWLPRRLVAFRSAYSGIDFKVAIGNTAQAVEAVTAGLAEIGFIEGPVDTRAMKTTALARDQLAVVVGRDHPWAARRDIAAADMASIEWVMREPGSGTRAVFEEDLHSLGIPFSSLSVVVELPRNEAVIAAVEAGLGATAVSISAAAAGLLAGRLCRVPIDLPARDFSAIQSRERYESKAATAFLEMLRAMESEAGMIV